MLHAHPTTSSSFSPYMSVFHSLKRKTIFKKVFILLSYILSRPVFLPFHPPGPLPHQTHPVSLKTNKHTNKQRIRLGLPGISTKHDTVRLGTNPHITAGNSNPVGGKAMPLEHSIKGAISPASGPVSQPYSPDLSDLSSICFTLVFMHAEVSLIKKKTKPDQNLFLSYFWVSVGFSGIIFTCLSSCFPLCLALPSVTSPQA